MFGFNPQLSKIESDLQTTTPETRDTRTLALIDLNRLIKKDSSIRNRALKIFRAVVAAAKEPWPTTLALRGIEYLAGPEEAHPLRLHLLQDPRPKMRADIASDIRDPAYAPVLIDLLTKSTDTHLSEILIRRLSTMHTPDVLPAFIALLNDKQLRPIIADALGELGDPRAIPHLEPLLTDRTEAWPVDNHGPMLHVADLADASLRRLRRQPPKNI